MLKVSKGFKGTKTQFELKLLYIKILLLSEIMLTNINRTNSVQKLRRVIISTEFKSNELVTLTQDLRKYIKKK